MLGRGRCEVQYQMSKEFGIHILKFMKSNNMNFSQFANYVKIDEYMLYKIMSRKIKMSCFLSLLEKLANCTQANGIKLGDRQPTICKTKYD